MVRCRRSGKASSSARGCQRAAKRPSVDGYTESGSLPRVVRAALAIERVSNRNLPKMVIFKLSAGDFGEFGGAQGRSRQPETYPNASKPAKYRPFSSNPAIWLNARTAWLGREDSNLRMGESKSPALPLGDAPKAKAVKGRLGPRIALAPPVYRESSAISTT